MKKSLIGSWSPGAFHRAPVSAHCYSTSLSEDPSLSVVTEKLTAAFDDVKQFCDAHDLKINLEKTRLILFKKLGKPMPDDFHLILDNYTVTLQKTVKLTGVTLDQHFTFGLHIDNVANKC